MNILSVGIKCDLLALMHELAEGRDIVINQIDNGKAALVHLGETTISYDWIVIDHRESERYSERWDSALSDLSKCKVIIIPRDESSFAAQILGENTNDVMPPGGILAGTKSIATVFELGIPKKKQA